MDYIPSMFQFDQSKDHQELCQIISNNFPCKDQHDDGDDHNIQIRFEDHHHHHHNHHHHHQAHPPTPSQDGREDLTNKRRRALSPSRAFGEKDGCDDDGQENPSDKKKKKVLHREIERQRRKEMAALYATLRSLIPLQHLKGKRSISDQMHVAEIYIKELQRKNQESRDKRDLLKKNSNTRSFSSSGNTNYIGRDRESKRRDPESIISVMHSRAGIEVVLNTAFGEGLSLARLLRVLDERGLNVVACVSAKVNDRFLHTIESEAVSGERDLDLAELEQKLKNLIV